MGEQKKCEVCNASEASISCTECEQLHYCSTTHKEAHWNEHKTKCRPSVIEYQDRKVGRYFVAGRDVKAGELLFREKAIAVGPRATSYPMCLGCNKAVTDVEFLRCPGCSWPVCSSSCATTKLHKAECTILAADKEKLGQPKNLGNSPCYDIILVLRCLILRDSDPEAFDRLLDMASHAIRLVNDHEPYHMATIRYIENILKADFDSKFIHHARGAIMANCFEYSNSSGITLRGVYPKVGRFNHSCLPNVALSVDECDTMFARAAVDLKAFSPLLITYTDIFIPLWERQAHIDRIHYFTCDCSRCDDPSELGLHYSSLKCEKCSQQYMEPKTYLGETVWECPKCQTVYPDSVIKMEYFQWVSKYDFSDTGTFIQTHPQGVRNILAGVERAFHSTHHVWVMAALVGIRTLESDESRDSLTMRHDLWKRLLSIYDVLEPGMTSRRGVAMYELGLSLANLTSVEMKEGLLIDHFYKMHTQEALEYLQNSLDILDLEPPDSYERKWYDKALLAIKSIQQDLEAAGNKCIERVQENSQVAEGKTP
ncbi:hypothetical protein SK128_012618 [Halocaridina rubra]|uniref:Uncharacterized protein n=1 Tax=Halocaridina rubra TaxID=373956 RepID=A0AAN8WY64_HALRR